MDEFVLYEVVLWNFEWYNPENPKDTLEGVRYTIDEISFDNKEDYDAYLNDGNGDGDRFVDDEIQFVDGVESDDPDDEFYEQGDVDFTTEDIFESYEEAEKYRSKLIETFKEKVQNEKLNEKKLKEKNIINENGLNIEYSSDKVYTKYNKSDGLIEGKKETYKEDVLILSCEYKKGLLNGEVKDFKENDKTGDYKISSITNYENNEFRKRIEFTHYLKHNAWKKLIYTKNNQLHIIEFSVNGAGNDFSEFNIGPVSSIEIRENNLDFDLEFPWNIDVRGRHLNQVIYNFDNNGDILYVRRFKDGFLVELSIGESEWKDEEKKIIDSLETFECFFPNGKPIETKQMKNGLVNGIWKRFYETGKLRYETNHKNGLINGLEREYYRNGILKIESNWKNGKREGAAKRWYENGQLEVEINFENGAKGSFKNWYENGQLKKERNYKEVNHWLTKAWHENGQLQYEGSFKNDKKDGLHKEYNENGESMGELSYKDGELNGVQKQYSKDGKLERVVGFKNDVKHGPDQKFYRNGQLINEINFINGKQADGVVETFHENGQKKRSVTIINKKYHNFIREWDENGNILFEEKWDNGKQIGQRKTFI